MDTPIEVVIRTGHTDTNDALREYVVRRLSFVLRRFSHRIRRLTVRLADVNGPRGGLDSRCSIAADLYDGQRLFVHATAAWPFASVTQAASRLGGAVRRSFRAGRPSSRRAYIRRSA
jgi:putative sigma-54 modulation protein